jgi:uncharacterized integral membrane protein
MAVAGAFAYYNATPVTLNYAYNTIEMPLALFALIAFMVGVLFAILLMVPAILNGRKRVRQVRKTCKEQEQELKSLRKLPLDDVAATES